MKHMQTVFIWALLLFIIINIIITLQYFLSVPTLTERMGRVLLVCIYLYIYK